MSLSGVCDLFTLDCLCTSKQRWLVIFFKVINNIFPTPQSVLNNGCFLGGDSQMLQHFCLKVIMLTIVDGSLIIEVVGVNTFMYSNDIPQIHRF